MRTPLRLGDQEVVENSHILSLSLSIYIWTRMSVMYFTTSQGDSGTKIYKQTQIDDPFRASVAASV